MSRPLPKLLAGLLLTATFATNANAAFESRLGGQAVYDTALNVTWLTNANLAATDTFGVSGINANGTMTWTTAQSWIAAMNAANYLGYNNWRLPTTGPINGTSYNYNNSNNGSTDFGKNISAPGTAFAGSTGSEMAYLFYNDLGDKSDCNPSSSTASTCVVQAGYGLTNTGPFSNLQRPDFDGYQWGGAYNGYWSGTAYAGTTGGAWLFGMNYGVQGSDPTNFVYRAMVVASGDVAAVPEPETWGMMLAGLALIGAVTKQRLRQSLSI